MLINGFYVQLKFNWWNVSYTCDTTYFVCESGFLVWFLVIDWLLDILDDGFMIWALRCWSWCWYWFGLFLALPNLEKFNSIILWYDYVLGVTDMLILGLGC